MRCPYLTRLERAALTELYKIPPLLHLSEGQPLNGTHTRPLSGGVPLARMYKCLMPQNYRPFDLT